MQLVISEILLLRRYDVQDISRLQIVATFMAATSDARERSSLGRQLTSESKICVCLRSDNSKGIIC